MRLIKALVAAGLVAFALNAHPSAQSPNANHVVAGQILVKFTPGATGQAKADAHRQGGGRVLNEIASTRLQLVAVAAGDEMGAMNRYRRNPNVLYAEPNFIRRVPEPIGERTPITHVPATETIPGDHWFKEQWALHNTGQLFYCVIPAIPDFCFYLGTPDADIDAPEAWAISTGHAVTVAVIDTGIDYTHPDLAANYAGGIDYVTLDGDPMDDHGHGTHVSGTIAAAMNNPTGDPAEDEGVVGVAPFARIRAYKVCDANGNCSDFAIQQAIVQAVADGAKVINMSLGAAERSQGLDDAVQFAWNAGLVIVAGAGNDNSTNLFYPAAFDHVISVGAFDEDHRRATFSNYGTGVDISAPGNVILSAYPMAACLPSTAPGDIGCYNWLSGTSMATPHVSGAAALVWSRADVTSNQQVVDIILNSADPQGVDAVRLDSWTIHGGLNLHDAMSFGVTNLPPVANAGPDQTVPDLGGDGVELITLNGSASSDADGSILAYEWREGTSVLALEASPSIFLTVGVHTLTLQVTDDRGATGTDTVVISVRGNTPPTANAGADQTVIDGDGNGVETVTLNGSASSDSDGSILSYEWSEGATVLTTGASPLVSFAVGTHTLTLRVTDDQGATGTDTVVVMVNARPNTPPTANAGADQTVIDGDGNGVETVTLNGGASSDIDGSIVRYEWREGSTVLATIAAPAVTLMVGTHTLTLTVTDNNEATGSDTVVVTVNPFAASSTHVGDLDSSASGNKSAWTARVTITVHNTIHQIVAGAVVSGTWSGGATGTGTCTTGAGGTCSIVSASLRKRDNTATFTVSGITASGLSYSVNQNHEPDGDSTGTAITIAKP
jgi:thermitase